MYVLCVQVWQLCAEVEAMKINCLCVLSETSVRFCMPCQFRVCVREMVGVCIPAEAVGDFIQTLAKPQS